VIGKGGMEWGQIFYALGFAGLGRVEEVVVASLITGEAILLIGRHGSAKTAVCREIAKIMSLNFHAYDASKSVFEDVIGFPNPKSIHNGMIEYTPTAISMWDKEFVLVDELSRAQPQMQNKWLEVIRSRTLMGKKLENLKYIFAAMNPTEYIGAMPLDDALASRFAFVVEMPDVQTMSDEDATNVIINIGDDDSPGMNSQLRGRPGNGKVHAILKARLETLIKDGRERCRVIDKMHREKITKYLLFCMRFFGDRAIHIDGRRLGMMRRSITTFLAINDFSQMDFYLAEPIVMRAMAVILPFPAMSQDRPSKEMLGMMHRSAMDYACKKGARSANGRFSSEDAFSNERIIEVAGMEPEKQFKFVNAHVERHSKAEPNLMENAMTDIVELCLAINKSGAKLDHDVLEHLFDYSASVLGLVEINNDHFIELVEKVNTFNQGNARQCRNFRSALAKVGDAHDAVDQAKGIVEQIPV